MIGKEFNFANNLRLRLFAEIRNLTDHKNILYVYPDTGDPIYNRGEPFNGIYAGSF